MGVIAIINNIDSKRQGTGGSVAIVVNIAREREGGGAASPSMLQGRGRAPGMTQ